MDELTQALADSVEDCLEFCAQRGKTPEKPTSNEDDQMRESLAMLQMLEASSADIEAGRLRDSEEVFTDLRRMIAKKRETQEK